MEEEMDKEDNFVSRRARGDFGSVRMTTSDLGWPSSNIAIYAQNNEYFFHVKQLIEELGLKSHVEKNGFKFIDKLLVEQGKRPY